MENQRMMAKALCAVMMMATTIDNDDEEEDDDDDNDDDDDDDDCWSRVQRRKATKMKQDEVVGVHVPCKQQAASVRASVRANVRAKIRYLSALDLLPTMVTRCEEKKGRKTGGAWDEVRAMLPCACASAHVG